MTTMLKGACSNNLLSIITVCFNAAETIEMTIQSIIKQRYKDIEYIIIDGGSTDGTLDIIRKYSSNIAYWISEKDQGIYDAMNKGISKASGSWIYFLGADDVLYDSEVISDVFVDMNAYKKGTKILYGNVVFSQSKILYGGLFSRSRIIKENICHQSLFYHISIFQVFGVFNLRYNLLSDWEFNMRVFSKCEEDAVFIDRTICFYNEQGSSTRKSDINFGRDYYKIILRYFSILEVIRYLSFKVLARLI